MTNQFHLHLISDSTGETVSSITRSVMSQFDDIKYEEHTWSLIRTNGQMQRVIEGIRETPGIVMYTILNDDLQKLLREVCKELKIPCVPVLARAINELSNYVGRNVKTPIVGRQHELDDEYFARVEAVNYTIAHDDGINTEDLEDADVVLCGVSRTSKTPTCIYLSYRGIAAANVPFVIGCPLPDILFKLKKPLVVGLVISPERLLSIRKSRLVSLQEDRDTSYVDIDSIKNEVIEARKLFNKQKWPILDVTRKSVEETTALIFQFLSKHRAENKDIS